MNANRPTVPAEGADPDALLRTALTGVSVAAYRRGIGLSGHVDSRLPCRLRGDTAGLAEFVRQGLSRTVAAASTREIALGLWCGGPGEPALMLEASRAIDDGATPVTGMTALWTPSARTHAFAQPLSHRFGNGVEAVLVPLPDTLGPVGARIGASWGDAFSGKRMLSVTRVLLSRERWSASLASLGLTCTDAAGTEAAIAALAANRDSRQAAALAAGVTCSSRSIDGTQTQ